MNDDFCLTITDFIRYINLKSAIVNLQSKIKKL